MYYVIDKCYIYINNNGVSTYFPMIHLRSLRLAARRRSPSTRAASSGPGGSLHRRRRRWRSWGQVPEPRSSLPVGRSSDKPGDDLYS